MSSHSNLAQLHEPGTEIRRARGAYVKSLMDADGRSARWLAAKIGISNSAFSDRLKGKAPFLADELEHIAAALKIPALEFYRDYINAPVDGPSKLRTLVPKVAGSIPVGGTVIAFPTRQRVAANFSHLAPVTPLPQGA